MTSRVMTPLDFRDRLLSFRGAAFGLEPILTQSAWFRPHNRSEEVEGLYLVGAGTHPGAGTPGVLSSARVLDALVPDARAFEPPVSDPVVPDAPPDARPSGVPMGGAFMPGAVRHGSR